MNENNEIKLSELTTRFLHSLESLSITGYKLKQDGVINNEPTLTKIKKGIQQPSRKTISLYCEKYGVSESWIYTGNGNMLTSNIEVSPVPVNEQKGNYFTETHNGVKYYDLGNGNYRMVVKLVPHCAYARFINETNTLEPDKENWEEESFIVDKIAHGRYFAFEVKGDSMDDGTRASFEEGDRVLARELDRIHWKDGIRFNSYPYWVVSFGNSVLIKEIISQDLEQGTITFHSLNPSPEYSDFFLHMDEIRSLYYVVQKKPKTVKYNK